MGRFLGIAWDTGDLFSFKVGSEPNGDWRQGREFIRNVVRTRDESEIPAPDAKEEPDLSQFRFQRLYKTKKRKRSQEFIYDLRDIPDGNEETGDINERSDGEGEVKDVATKSDMMPVDHSDNESTDQGEYDKEDDKSSGNRPTTDQQHPNQPTQVYMLHQRL